MLRPVASVPYQKYIQDKILSRVTAFLSSNLFSIFIHSVLIFPLKILEIGHQELVRLLKQF